MSAQIGQFDDAVEPITRPRHAYLDQEANNRISDESSDSSLFDEEQYSDYLDEEPDDIRVEDEDWEIAERDFTKQYNRLRQHVAVRAGNETAITLTSSLTKSPIASLPAVNRPRSLKPSDPVSLTQAKDRTVDQLAALSKYSSRLAKIDLPYDMGVSVNRKGASQYANLKDKSDRATSEQVLDPRTRIILFKMIGRGLIYEVNGCVSTGKEANVYHAVTTTTTHLALKIYKTSILIFKDRDRYVTGEHRFRRGYSRNPRKMVRLWAEKEMRNLKRLTTAGIHCPEPVEVRENVLVMGFLGDSAGWASPRLKDAEIPTAIYPTLYAELVLKIRRMYHACKLVHADLSEYNIIFHDNHLYIIDVSQSVEHDHPHAFDFLRNDIRNVEDYFGRCGVNCLGLRRCFEFVTKERLSEGGELEDAVVLNRWLGEPMEAKSESSGGLACGDDAGSEHEDSVFMKSYIPRTLNEVYDPERDAAAAQQGINLIYSETIGIVDSRRTHGRAHFADEGADNDADGKSDEEEGDGDGGTNSSDEEDRGFGDKKHRGHRHEDRESKKERKKAVKEEQRAKRKIKMPKAEKKKKIKSTTHKQ